MGAPPHILVPGKGSFSSPGTSIFSPSDTESSATPSSITIPDSSPSSFTHRASAVLPTPNSQSRQDIIIRDQKQHLANDNAKRADLRKRDAADSRHSKKCVSRSPPRGSERALMGSCKSCNARISIRKTCCRCAGAFAADCAALCCCPCAIISLLTFMLVELPSALATRMITRLKKRLAVKDAGSSCGNKHGDEGHYMSTPTRTHKESCKPVGKPDSAVHIIRFDTENLLKHFDAENVGFGCLSQKRE